MSAGTEQSNRVRRTGRIIERPRLIKQLDAAESPVILLVGPAGYGKTTLARQWAKTLRGVVWVASTPSHRDVVTFSEDVAAGIDALGGNASRFIGEFVRARNNPQRAAREIASALVARAKDAPVQWLIIDDYQEVAASPEVEEMVTMLRRQMGARLLVASRIRPRWATAREVLYGGIAEINARELALTSDETVEVVGARPDLDPLVEQAKGWPAVLALAARLERDPSRPPLPPALHEYVAEELFRSAPAPLRDQLLELALMPRHDTAALAERFENPALIVEQARDLGFIGGGDDDPELHPLLREFLLAKIREAPDSEERIRTAIDVALKLEAWESALEFVLRFDLSDLIDPVVQRAFTPLVRGGRLGILSSFADRIRAAQGFPAPAVDLIEAEVALRDGQFDLAFDLCTRAQRRLPSDHPLLSRAHAIEGQCAIFRADYEIARAAFNAARASALDEADDTEAIHGIAVAKVYGELEDPQAEVEALATRRHVSPLDLLRHTTSVLTVRRYVGGLSGDLGLSEPLHALSCVEDPRVRTAFTYTAANVLSLRAEYRRAIQFAELFAADTTDFDLEFALPFVGWTSACICIGLRRFGDADRYLQSIEDAASDPQQRHHELNARILRTRLLLQVGKSEEAVKCVSVPAERWPIPRAWRAEYLATRALALVAVGQHVKAEVVANEAQATSKDLAAQVASCAARAAAHASAGDSAAIDHLVTMARATDIWDPVLTALRVSEPLTEQLTRTEARRGALLELCQRADDHVLARRAGIRSRVTRSPHEVLSNRELEVLGLMAQGGRNREIAQALFIAESTVKVHVRHILEKLGVRSRAEAVARYERLQPRL